MGLVQDLRFATRVLLKQRGLTAVAVLTLAVGLAANTAIFSLVDALILRPLPVRDPGQLVELVTTYPGDPPMNGFAWKYYTHFRDHNHVFSDFVGVSPTSFKVTRDRQVGTVAGNYVVGALFPALGVRPALGRLIGPDDDRPGSADAAVVVVSWAYWQNQLAGDAGAVGQSLIVNGVPATVIGVTPREFVGLEPGVASQLWVPAALADGPRDRLGMKVIARLKVGVSIAQAQAELRVLDKVRIEEIARTSGNAVWRHTTLDVKPAGAGFSALRSIYGTPLLTLQAVAGLLLLVTCVTVGSIMLSGAAARQREMAVRVALGAGRLRLCRQVLTESLLLSTTGGAAAVLLAYAATGVLLRTLSSGRQMPGLPAPLDLPVTPDGRALLFTATLVVLAAALFGLAPAAYALFSTPTAAMREGGNVTESRSRRRFGYSLVVIQVALSLVLVATAGLFARHLSHLRDAGFDRDSVLLVTLNPTGSGLDRARLTSLYQDLLARLEAIPGVRSATLSAVTPIEGPGASRFVSVDDFQEAAADRRYQMLNWVAPRYFATLGTPLVAGRDFQFADRGRPPVAIVNQTMARHYFPDGPAIGKHLRLDGDSASYQVVGVVGDTKYMDLHEPVPPPTVYFNAFQQEHIASQFAIRTSGSPTSIIDAVRHAVGDVVKSVPIAKVTTLSEQADASIVTERVVAMLSAGFGGLTAVLAAIGLYGLLAYSVTRRAGEIGVRMALGATVRHAMLLVVKDALIVVVAGVAMGLPLALWGRRAAAPLVSAATAASPMPLVLAVAATVAVALLAACVPARRAARIDPATALRQQ